jgi:hypothetical protein
MTSELAVAFFEKVCFVEVLFAEEGVILHRVCTSPSELGDIILCELRCKSSPTQPS